jgi:hypothetical protein
MQQDDRIFAVVGACVVAAVALVAAIMWVVSGMTVDAPERATVMIADRPTPTPAASRESNSQIVEGSIRGADDDELVRNAAARLSAHPRLAALLVNDRLLERFVAAVDAVAGGFSPRDEVDFLNPGQAFLVREDEGRLVIAAGSYRRYSAATDVFASLNIEGSVELYRKLRPRLEEIYEQTAWASEDFDARFRDAVDHLLEVEVPSGQVEVEQRAIVYAFAEDSLEHLSHAQRQLIRMGPENARRVQGKLLQLRSALGWPERAPMIVTAELELPAESEILEQPLIAETAPEVLSDAAIEPIEIAREP